MGARPSRVRRRRRTTSVCSSRAAGESLAGFRMWLSKRLIVLALALVPAFGWAQGRVPMIGRTVPQAGGVQVVQAPQTPTNPNPAVNQTVAIPVTLSWTATNGTTCDVFFGTSPAPPLVSSHLSGQNCLSYVTS